MNKGAGNICGDSDGPESSSPSDIYNASGSTPDDPASSWKARVIRGSAWTVAGYGVSQALRLLGNLVLTRLLLPEAFGLVALAGVFLQGIQMFSDMGIDASVIQNKDGDQASFLRTAWTIQILRGFVLLVGMIALTWPVAIFYDESMLFSIMPALGFVVVVNGFTSPNMFLSVRRLQLKRLTLLNLFAQVLNLSVMISLAYVWPSVWVLVIGACVQAATIACLSHVVLGSLRMRLEFRRDVARELFHFGKWIFLATILGFITNRSGHLVLGKFMAIEVFGVYSIAVLLAEVPEQLVKVLSNRILFPLYARTAELDMDQLRRRTFKIRRILLLVLLPITWVMVVFGPEIVTVLYDERYAEAGWMLQVLGVRAIFANVIAPMGIVLLATGKSRRHMTMVFFNMTTLLLSILVGGLLGGTSGILIAFAVAPVLYYPFLAALIHKENSWMPALDLSAVLVSGVAVGMGFWLKGFFGFSL